MKYYILILILFLFSCTRTIKVECYMDCASCVQAEAMSRDYEKYEVIKDEEGCKLVTETWIKRFINSIF